MFGNYRQLLHNRAFLLPFILAGLTAVALGMTGLGLILAVRERFGSLGPAGITSGAFGVGNAVGLLVQGRLIDWYGQARVIVPASLSCAAALAAAVIPAWSTPAVVVCLAVLAGAAFPATISCLRILTPELVPTGPLRTGAYALLAASFGVAMTIGPLLVSGIVALAGPGAAVITAAAITALGGVAFAATSTRTRGGGTRIRSNSGRPAGLLTLLVGNSGTGFASGVTAVALPAVGIAHGQVALAGLGFAALSGGDLLGGLAYGSFRWNSSPATHLRRAIGLWAAVAWLVAGAAGSVPGILAALAISGLVGACVPICSSALLDQISPAGSLGTQYTLMVGLGLLAAAAGNAVAGILAQRYGPSATLLVSAAVITATAAWVNLRSRTLHERISA